MTGCVLVTRSGDDCGELARRLEPCGLTVRPYPVLRVRDVQDEPGWAEARETLAAAGDGPAWLLLASPRAAGRLAAGARQRSAEWLLELPTAVVGRGTETAAHDAGLRVELVGPGTGLGLAGLLLERLEPASVVVFACGHHRRPELPDALAASGHRVVPLELYRMERTPTDELPELPDPVTAVVLTSPRSARFYLDALHGRPVRCQHWALGPTTRDAAAALGIRCRIPRRPDLDSLAEDLCTT